MTTVPTYHVYEKAALIRRLDSYLSKTLGEADDKGIFDNLKDTALQKGVAGTVVEMCIFGYEPDGRQEADLIITEGDSSVKTELKATGLVTAKGQANKLYYTAKEPMSITAVGVFDIDLQTFETSHFWEKAEHLLIIYYHYLSDHAVDAYDYKDFPIVGYEFHQFSDEDVEILRKDWQYVHDLCSEVISHHPGSRHSNSWRTAVRDEYIAVHGRLRRDLTYIDLAPKFPPRFRLKKPTVSAIVQNHFGYGLQQLPGRYTAMSDVDAKCHALTELYKGKTVGQLCEMFGIHYDPNSDNKSINQWLIIAMFGGEAKALGDIELFQKFGLVAKSIVMTSKGGRTEDMKLYHIDFNEMVRTEYDDPETGKRPFVFEDSEMYGYFTQQELLCIVFQEPAPNIEINAKGKRINTNPLWENVFVGFKRLVFSDEFIDTTVRRVWDDTRDKIMNKTLVEVIGRNKDGSVRYNGDGSISTAPNFMKGRQNAVFIRGSAQKTTLKYKTETVNNIRMIPQYLWIKGSAVIEELKKSPEL